MSSNLISTLRNIAAKPNASATTKLITARRICRVFVRRLDSICSERRAILREAAKLEAFLPFTQKAIAGLERRAEEHREAEYNGAESELIGFGMSLLVDAEGLANALGFDRLCDVLSVSSVHREQALQDGDASIYNLTITLNLEESAGRKGDEWDDGGPLLRAFVPFVMRAYDNRPDLLEAAKLELARQRRPKLRVVRTAGEGLDAIVSDTRQTDPGTALHEQINDWSNGKTVRPTPLDIV